MANQELESIRNVEINEDDHLLSDILKQYTRYWKWYILAVILAVGLAHIYLRYATPIYSTQATILLKEDGSDSGFSELSALEDLGIFAGNSGSKLADEIEILNSRRLMEKVVTELNLNIQYFAEGNVKTVESYIAPITVSFLNNDTLYALESTKVFRLANKDEGSYSIRNTTANDETIHRYGETIDLGYGKFIVLPSIKNQKIGNWKEMLVRISPVKNIAAGLAGQVSVNMKGQRTNVLLISMKNPIEKKSRDVINTLIDKYNEDAVADKNEVSTNTAEFIANRLKIISLELDSVETTKETFKRQNRITNIPSEAQLYVQSNNEYKKRILDVSTKIRLVEDLKNYLESSSGSLLPSNLGVLSGGLSNQVVEYNSLVMQRGILLKSSTPANPVVVTIDEELVKIKNVINSGIQNELSSLEITESELIGQERIYSAKISAVPSLEKESRGILRQQEIKEQLYLYLLKKREETAISLAITSPNAKVIDEAITSSVPVSPKRRLIKFVAGILGFLLVVILVYIKNLLDTKIHSRSDVEALSTTPILGELPLVDGEENLVIKLHDRSILAESFRILRTNLDYFTRSENGRKKNVIYVTSTIKGEGKTFVAFNLTMSLASTGKKVLLVGADIRNPQVHRYMDLKSSSIGLTEYMFGLDTKVEEIITHETLNEQKIDIILSGRIPPNPAELFLNSRFDTLIDTVSKEYDYVIVDTAPTMQVTDTLLISQYADVTIFVTRADYTQKRILQYSKDLFQEKKLKNMTYVINGVKTANFGYGAKYGYGYDNQEDGLWQRLKHFLLS